jgi:hypothetical protein
VIETSIDKLPHAISIMQSATRPKHAVATEPPVVDTAAIETSFDRHAASTELPITPARNETPLKHPAPAPRHAAPLARPGSAPSERPATDRPSPIPAPAPTIRYDSTLIEMFGFSEPIPAAAAATAVLAKPEVDPLPGLPALKEMRRPTDAPGDTGTLVTRLWAATETTPLITDWKPASFDSLAASGRTFRWPIIVAALLVLFGGLALIHSASTMPEHAATTAKQTYLHATTDYAAQLPNAHQTVAVITDPASQTAALSDAAVSLSSFDSPARALFEVAAEPLPTVLPLVSRTPLDALTPVRRSMATASEIGLSVERRLGDALSYRLVLEKAFQLPQLPTAATQQQIATLGVSLGLAVTTTSESVTQLPDEPFLAEHLAGATQLSLRLDDWQVEYLDALRQGDQEQAAALVQEIDQRIAALQAGLASPLAAMHDWAETQLNTLEGQLDTITAELS